MRIFLGHIAPLLLASLIPATASAQMVENHPCAMIGAADERLACYDNAFPPSVAAVAEASRKAFGLMKGQEATMPARIEATVSAIREINREGRIITLDNGQVWRETQAYSSLLLKAGDKIIIREAALSSFLLVKGPQSARVRRIK
jgi:hypothetical protein